MCGIVGLLLKRPEMREHLGEYLVPMLIGMSERGPDSAGLAVFNQPLKKPLRQISFYTPSPQFDWMAAEERVRGEFDCSGFSRNGNHAVMITSSDPAQISEWSSNNLPGLHVLSRGSSMVVYKDVGLPAEIATRYGFGELRGTHAVAHTRMATESANTPQNAHPYTAGDDWCLVHNGSLANPNSIRRRLEKVGIRFESDCDTEAACRFIAWRLQAGDALEDAIERAFSEFDGFFTFLMGTGDKLALVRDPYACKPAVVAETPDYVAIASEFRSLAHLPGVDEARIFEPKPAEIYSWSI